MWGRSQKRQRENKEEKQIERKKRRGSTLEVIHNMYSAIVYVVSACRL